MHKILLLLLFMASCYTGSAQTDSLNSTSVAPIQAETPPKKFSLNPWEGINGYRFSVGYLKDFEAEASYLITSFPQKDPGYGGMAMLVHYIGAGLEYVKDGPTHAVGAKLSYEASFALLAAQVGTDYLVADGMQQARIMPKIGLSMFGVLTLYYGRNFNLIENSRLQPHEYVLSFQVNLYDMFFD